MVRRESRRCWTLGSRTGRHPRKRRTRPSSGWPPAAHPFMAPGFTTQGPGKPNPSQTHDEGRRPNPETEADRGRWSTPRPDATFACICWRRTPDVSTFIFRCPSRPCVVVLLAALTSRPSLVSDVSKHFTSRSCGSQAAGLSSGTRWFFFSLNGREHPPSLTQMHSDAAEEVSAAQSLGFRIPGHQPSKHTFVGFGAHTHQHTRNHGHTLSSSSSGTFFLCSVHTAKPQPAKTKPHAHQHTTRANETASGQ